MLRCLFTAGLLLFATVVHAADWSWQWQQDGDATVSAEITPFLYGKTWAYTLEIDDGPVTTLTVAQPLLARYHFTDAPPGVAGGKPLPFVGGAAIVVQSTGTRNSTVLTWDDVRQLVDAGWGVINHSYYHAGRPWTNPPELLTPEQFRHDLFWSQSIIAAEMERVPTHLAYPNGYTGYRDHFAEFGLRSGSRVSGSGGRAIYGDKANFLDISRRHLDENPWTSGGKSDPMWGFPGDLAEGDFHLDFTHGISKDPNSDNFKRWTMRLDTIAARHGQNGADDVWSAPTGDVLDYVSARREANVEIRPGALRLTLPDSLPGTRLTLKLQGIPAGTQLAAPAGGLIYRDGDAVYLTTPMIGGPGASHPQPRVRRIFEGPVHGIHFDEPVKLAAVRLLQSGPVADGFELAVDAVTPEGAVESLVRPEDRSPSRAWGRWLLCSTVPLRDAVLTSELRIARDRSIDRMEIWIVED